MSVLGLLVNLVGIYAFQHGHSHGGGGHGHSHGGGGGGSSSHGIGLLIYLLNQNCIINFFRSFT